jgi:hypothetical protein
VENVETFVAGGRDEAIGAFDPAPSRRRRSNAESISTRVSAQTTIAESVVSHCMTSALAGSAIRSGISAEVSQNFTSRYRARRGGFGGRCLRYSNRFASAEPFDQIALAAHDRASLFEASQPAFVAFGGG